MGSPKTCLFRKVSRNSRPPGVISAGPLVSARLIHCVASSPSYSTSLVHLFTHPVVMTHAPLFVTAHHVPTLSRSHPISFDSLSHRLALSRSHTEARSISHQLSYGIFLCQRLTPSRFIPPAPDCLSRDRTIQRTDTEPRTVRRTIQRTGNTHCCCSNCCCTHTVAPTTAALLMHHTAQ